MLQLVLLPRRLPGGGREGECGALQGCGNRVFGLSLEQLQMQSGCVQQMLQ